MNERTSPDGICDDSRMARTGSAWRGRHTALLGLLVLAGLSVWAAWWWTHAAVLDERVGGAGFDMAPQPVEKATLHAEVASPRPRGDADETLTFRSVELRFAENTADARAQLSVCVPRDPAEVVGVITGSLTKFCREVRLIEPGTTMRWRDGHPLSEYMVLTIEPSRPGKARIDQIKIDYSRDRAHLWQRGTALASVDITMRATE